MQHKRWALRIQSVVLLITGSAATVFAQSPAATQNGASSIKPNIVIIYSDDVGYGDISCYGAKKISTP